MTKKTEAKVLLYIRSVSLSTHTYAMQQGGGRHPCDRGIGFLSSKNPAVNLDGKGDRVGEFYSEEDWNALNIAKLMQEKTGVNVELVDLSTSFWNRMRFAFKGSEKTPRFAVNGEYLPDITSVEQLISYLK
ncbi:MAG: hypothetical protein ACFFDT_18760 [Candidatus Hodarchaeota archaeon]